ncbi:LPXTG cell wall anchor domain-containing protein [Leucobacter luti]|uniref:LPXTG cell wall anchor domain-containing protein n=1 Tax=Leucobacter luti TaxID=340320 RepID=UPI003D062550
MKRSSALGALLGVLAVGVLSTQPALAASGSELLPTTGGSGVTGILIAGGALILLAAVIFGVVLARRKRAAAAGSGGANAGDEADAPGSSGTDA